MYVIGDGNIIMFVISEIRQVPLHSFIKRPKIVTLLRIMHIFATALLT